METNNALSNKLDQEKNNNYHLSVQWNSNSLDYTILNIDEKKYNGLFKIPVDDPDNAQKIIDKALSENNHFSHQYTSASLMVQSFKAMLVPETLFNANNLNAFLKFHHEIDEKEHIHFTSIKLAEAFVVFSIPAWIEELIKKYQPNVQLAHHALPLIDQALKQSQVSDQTTSLYIHFGPDFFDILVVRGKKVLLFNSFFYKKYSDVVYFLANIINLFSLHPNNTKIIISGMVELNSEIEVELKKIFKSIQFAQYNLDFKYGDNLYGIPNHQYVHLLNLYSCE